MISYHEDAPDLFPKEQARADASARFGVFDGLGYGLAGAHRTGKTSLAEKIAERNSWLPMVRTSAKDAAKAFGFDVNNPGDFAARMDWQEHLIEVFAAQYAEQTGAFVTDRTPLDMAGYLLADVPVGEIDRSLERRVEAYIDRCFELTERHFNLVVIIQPGIPHVVTEGSPAPNRAYQEKLNAIMLGLSHDLTTTVATIPRGVIDFDQRLTIIAKLISESYGQYATGLTHLPS